MNAVFILIGEFMSKKLKNTTSTAAENKNLTSPKTNYHFLLKAGIVFAAVASLAAFCIFALALASIITLPGGLIAVLGLIGIVSAAVGIYGFYKRPKEISSFKNETSTGFICDSSELEVVKNEFMNEPIAQLFSLIEKKCNYVPLYSNTPEGTKRTQKGILHIEVEKYLNNLYSLEKLQKQQEDLKIVLTSKGSDGFGDVIWGIRSIQAMQALLPLAHFSIVSDALDKFQLFVSPSPKLKLIEAKGSVKDFPEKDIGRQALSESDLVLDGPYLWYQDALSQIYDLDMETLVSEGRFLQGYEYDCARYWPNWAEDAIPNRFLSGVGDNAYGIFIIEELRNFFNTVSLPEDKTQYIQNLENEALKITLNRINSDGKSPMYFGYGEHLPAFFLETVTRLEDQNNATEDVIILLKSRDSEALEKYIEALKKDPLQNVSSIVTVEDVYPISDEELERLDKYAQTRSFYEATWLSEAKKKQADLRKQIPPGQNYLTVSKELVRFSEKGKRIIIVEPDTLNQKDMMAIYKFTQAITMTTGDQSLSEAISANKQILYDPRKTDSLVWLIQIAKREGLMLVAELFELCLSKSNVKRAVEILSSPEYAQQNLKLTALCQNNDFSKALQQMVCRRLITNQHPQIKPVEAEIHTLVEAICSAEQTLEARAQLMRQLKEVSENLIELINNPEVAASPRSGF